MDGPAITTWVNCQITPAPSANYTLNYFSCGFTPFTSTRLSITLLSLDLRTSSKIMLSGEVCEACDDFKD